LLYTGIPWYNLWNYADIIIFYMTNVSIPPLISSIIFLLLGLLVYFRGGRSKVSRSFFFLCLFTFWWQFSWFILFNLQNASIAEVLVRVGYLGIILIPFAFFSFSVYFLRDVSRLDLWLARKFYFFPLIFIFVYCFYSIFKFYFSNTFVVHVAQNAIF